MAAKSNTCESNYCRYLPFFNLSDAEFNAVIGNWRYDFDTDLNLFSILPNPNKFSHKDPDNILNCPHSNYYSLTQLSQLVDSTSVSGQLLCFNKNQTTLFLHDFYVTRPLFRLSTIAKKIRKTTTTNCFKGDVLLPFIGSLRF